jgi:hypothetical protein
MKTQTLKKNREALVIWYTGTILFPLAYCLNAEKDLGHSRPKAEVRKNVINNNETYGAPILR